MPLNIDLIFHTDALFVAQWMQGKGRFISADSIRYTSHMPAVSGGGSRRLSNQMVVITIHRFRSGSGVG